MQLKHTEIPVELLVNLPEGLKLVRRHGREFLVVESIEGFDGTSLMSETVKIHGEPSIRILVRLGDTEGLIFVDAFWGSHAKLYGFIPKGIDGESIVEVRVPATGKSLMVTRSCAVPGCGCTKAIDMHLPHNGGHVFVCARLGCPGHAIEISNLPKPVSDTVSGINFFGAGNIEDNWFDELG